MCVDISLDPSGRLIEIGFIAGFKFFTGVRVRTKYPFAPASDIASVFFIFNTDVEYAVYIVLGVRLLIIFVLALSLSLSPVKSSEILL